ncbi:MAG: ABC transporter substrate-binding protein [Acetobacteraceae bacterium]
MYRFRLFVLSLLVAAAGSLTSAVAQQKGGVLRVLHRDSPGSLSIHEETTNSTLTPMMGVFNNLVMYDQSIPRNSQDTIRPDLATDWTWSPDGTELTFHLHQGVRWHDGKPFTAADVKCTWDRLIGVSTDKLRINPRAGWYKNLTEVQTTNAQEVVFKLKRPQPSFLAFLASGYSPVYPCHVPAAQMRSQPIGTGPFRFVEFRRGEGIRLERNPDYWKPGRPYLDGIEYTVVSNRATAVLSFVARKFDMTFPYEIPIPLVRDIRTQAPDATCVIAPNNLSINLLVNRGVAPFDKPGVNRAVALALDRKAFIDIISEGKSDQGGAMLPPPEGVWGMPPEMLRTLPGYGGDVTANREEARRIMAGLGYGPDKPLKVKMATRNVPQHRDPAVILIDQLKQIHIESELELIESANWPPRLTRRDFTLALNLTGSGGDDPDIMFYENYVCGAGRNFSGYCNKEIDALVDRQSAETNFARRRTLVQEIDRRLQQDDARPIIYLQRSATCMQPWVKGLTIMSNSMYTGWRLEDVWIDPAQAANRP